ncbi:MAG: response regulator, partial [Pseudomonadota bacterium]
RVAGRNVLGGNASNEKDGAMKWILIVDETPVVRDIAIAIVQELGLMATAAASVDEACALCREQAPDGLLIDEHVQNESAHDVLRRLRALPGGGEAVAFLSTTENEPAQMTAAGNAGFAGVLLKPYDISTIRNALRRGGLLALEQPRASALIDDGPEWTQ